MASQRRKNRYRLSVDIPTELHVFIKKRAEEKNSTVTKYVVKALLEKIKKEEKYIDRDLVRKIFRE